MGTTSRRRRWARGAHAGQAGASATVPWLGSAAPELAVPEWSQPGLGQPLRGVPDDGLPPADAARRAEHRRRIRERLAQARLRVEARGAFRRFLVSALTFAFALAVLAVVVARGWLLAQAGYQLDDLRTQIQQAQGQHQRLEAQVGRVEAPGQVEAAAHALLGMQDPNGMARVAMKPAMPVAATAAADTHSATVALAPPAPAEERQSTWVALNRWLNTWFTDGEVRAQRPSR